MPEFNHLSDMEGGASHYSPAVPEVYPFLADLLDELAVVFDGDTIHIGCDEVTLGADGLRSSAMLRDVGAPAVYREHVRKVAELAQRHWRRVLFFAEWADTRYRPAVHGSDEDIAALRDAGLSFVNWNYYDDYAEDYFPYLHRLQRHGVDQVISTGVWTWRQLFPSYTQTWRTLPVLTRLAHAEGVTDCITTAWNDTRDCFRELHYLNYAVAAEHHWNAASQREQDAFLGEWAVQFFGTPVPALVDAYRWLGDLNRLAFEAGRHDHRYPREANWRPIAAHALFWNYPVPGSGSGVDAARSRETADWARALHAAVAAAPAPPRNAALQPLLQYELRRAAWLFDSVVFNAKAEHGAAAKLAEPLRERLRELAVDFRPLWLASNIPQGLEGIDERFSKLIGMYDNAAAEPLDWDGTWGPARRMQTGAHPM